MFGAAPAGDRVSRVNRARAEAEAIAMIAQAPPSIQRRSFSKPIERQPCPRAKAAVRQGSTTDGRAALTAQNQP
jgi:hypothetical protein